MIFTIVILFSFLLCQTHFCQIEENLDFRSIYEIGDTLSIDDQNFFYPVCNGADGYETGDYFSFSDLNGNLNGGNYKITLISMNATW